MIVAALAIAVAGGALDAGSVDARIAADAHTLMLGHPNLVHICRVLTWLGSAIVVNAFVVVAAVAFWLSGRRTSALYVVAVRILTQIATTLLKHGVGRLRPSFEHPFIHVTGFSFPSGHASGAASAYLPAALVLCCILQRPNARRALLAGAITVCLVVAATRVLLGVHYLSDVVAGLALGGALAAGCWPPAHRRRAK